MLVFNKNINGNCYCCGIVRKHPQKLRHSSRGNWTNCLKFGICPKPNVPSNNVLAPSNAHQSKKIVQSKKLRTSNSSTGRWKRVNWNQFLEERKKQQEELCKKEKEENQNN
jgi:hypothetical protein